MSYLYNKKRDYWEVRSKIDGVRKYIGSYKTEQEARSISWRVDAAEDAKKYTLKKYKLKYERIEEDVVFLRPIKRLFANLWRKREIKKAEQLLLPPPKKK